MVAMTDEIKVYDEGYPSRRLLELIGDKWTPIIVYILGQGTKRYGEFAAASAGRVEENADADAPGAGAGRPAEAEGVRRSAAESRLRPDPAGPGIPGAGDF